VNLAETRFMIEFIAAIDSRAVTDEIVMAWAAFVEDVDPRDAMAATKHLIRTQPDLFIRPGHVLAAAKEQRELRRRAERAAMPRRDPFGNLAGTPESAEAYRRYREAHNERFNAPALPPPVRVVPSPYQEWERRRREASTKADSPIITDLDRIEDMERERERALRVLSKIIEGEKRKGDDHGSQAVEAEEGV
jgi:hypothetical protein